MAAPQFEQHANLAPGARVLVRDEEWLVRRVDALADGSYAVEVTGLSELVRNHDRIFLTSLDQIRELAPEDTQLVVDDSPRYRRSRLYIESLLRRTPPTDAKIHLGHEGAFQRKRFQLEPARLALEELRPRILIGDAVGLGKTLEVGILLTELIKRGRGERILVVALKSLLEQFQKELWSRFAIPLIRLDSVGIRRVRTKIPANRNPFTYFDKVIVSIDTLKDDGRYRHFLEQCHWDAIVIDECHNVANEGTKRHLLAERLARTTDALILTSATPHNGEPASFANLMNMLSPTAIADPTSYGPDDIRGLFVRRFKKDVESEVEADFRDRDLKLVRLPASPAEEDFFAALSEARFRTLDGKVATDALYRSTVLKAFLSSPAACRETLDNRIERIETSLAEGKAPEGAAVDRETLSALRDVCARVADKSCSKLNRLFALLEPLGYGTAAKAESARRVIIFSERIKTLEWLQTALRERFKLSDDRIDVFHGGLPDVDQMKLVASFGNEDSPIRILVASDVASEGVNLHFFCHWMIHFDIPWSLIKLEQRNGRIDRFGQKEPPQIRYLLNESKDPTTKGDLRIIERLVERETWIHRNLGEAGALMGYYSAALEERDVSRAIGRNVDPEEVIPSKPNVSLLEILKEAQSDAPSRDTVVADRSTLFADDFAFVEAGLDEIGAELPDQMDLEKDAATKTLRFFAPDTFQPILSRLPAETLPDHLRFDLSADRARVEQAIEEARREDGVWPRVQLLWELHPVVQWLTDKVLVRYERHEAPLIGSETLPPNEAVFLFHGQVSNKRAQPVVASWFGIPSHRGKPQSDVLSFEDVLAKTGFAKSITNRGGLENFVRDLQEQVPRACEHARDHVRVLRTARGDELRAPLKDQFRRLDEWARRARNHLDGRQRELNLKGLLTNPQREKIAREQRDIDRRLEEARTWVQTTLQTEDRPYVRLVAIFAGQKGAR